MDKKIQDMQEKRNKMRADRLANGLPANTMLWEKKRTAGNAVKLKCMHCVGGPTSFDDIIEHSPLKYAKGINRIYKADINGCEQERCPLHSLRPFVKKPTTGE